MSSNGPLISVTLPNYNHSRFLAEAFDTVLMQTYENFELLFVDDGSTDDSRDIVARYAAKDRRIKPVYFERNQGALAAHANSWARVTGELVFQYSSDDSLRDPDFFRLAVEALTAHPPASGYFGTAAIISDTDGQLIGYMGNAQPVGYIAPLPFLKGFLRHGFFVPGISSIWRKTRIDEVGYDYRLGPQVDYFVNHALPARHGVIWEPRCFANSRASIGAKSYSSNTKLQEEMGRFALFASKLKEVTRAIGNFEEDWTIWRQQKAREFLAKYGQSAVAALQHSSPQPPPI